jgi:cytoskeleton protein RodZ
MTEMVAATVLRGQDELDVVIPQAELKAMFRQAERELYRSKAFQQAVLALQTEVEELSKIQGSLQQACKEAIRLTLRQVFVASREWMEQMARPEPQDLPMDEAAPPPAPAQMTACDRSPSGMAESTPTEEALTEPVTDDDLIAQLPLLSQATKAAPSSSLERASSSMAVARSHPKQNQQTLQTQQAQHEQRNQVLIQLGQELRYVREQRSLSVVELHQRTLVPVHHIQAIEAGEVDRLPEDIYVRGFLRQLGDALGLDGAAIARILPYASDPTNPVPSWYQAEDHNALHPMHLYVGYTALIAGTMGSLVWMNQQPFDPFAAQHDFEWLNMFQISERHSNEQFEVTPNMTGVDAIAAPEWTSPESSTSPFNTPSFVQPGDLAPASR